MFIAFEGIDGSGKTTQAKLLSDRLSQDNIAHILTKEPGSTEHGQILAGALLKDGLDPIAELLIYCADRAQHYKDVIKPALAKEMWVVSDRSFYSTIAYNGYGTGVDLGLIEHINQAIAVPQPDLVIWLDVPVEIAKENIANRGDGDPRDRRSTAFFNRVRRGYQESLFGKDILRIVQRGSMDEVHQVIYQIVEQR